MENHKRLNWIVNNVIAIQTVDQSVDDYTAYLIASREWDSIMAKRISNYLNPVYVQKDHVNTP